MPDLAARFDRLPPYPLADVPRIRRDLRAQGVDVIDLGAGDADLPPPPAAVDALTAALAEPDMSRYPFQLGLPSFREAIASWMGRRFGVELDPMSELLPLIGSKEGISHLALCYVEPGDATIVPDPGYQAYLGGTILAGGEPYRVPLRPEHDFLVPPDALPTDVATSSRILYLNYPNNPTAAAAPAWYLEQAVAFCREHDVVLAFDNAYSEIAYDGFRPRSILELDGARDVAIEFHSLSKTYNMTGWRIGWAAGAPGVIGALARAKTFVDTGVFLALQRAGQACLESYDDWVPENVAVFERRRDAVADALADAGFDVTVPRATMYLWVPVPGEETAESFARRALVEQGVVLLPGSALGPGGEGFFRVALTVSAERLVDAARRLADLL